MSIISPSDAALIIGVSYERVMQLIKAGRIKSELIGRAYILKEKDVRAFQRQPSGRPKKAS